MRFTASLAAFVVVMFFTSFGCGGSPSAPTQPIVTNPPPSGPVWSEMRSMTAAPNPVSRRSSLKIDATYMVYQSGLAYVNVWSIRYPDGHEVELPRQTGTNGVAGVLTQSGTSWSTTSDQPLGDYTAIVRITESMNGMSNTITKEMPFNVQ